MTNRCIYHPNTCWSLVATHGCRDLAIYLSARLSSTPCCYLSSFFPRFLFPFLFCLILLWEGFMIICFLWCIFLFFGFPFIFNFSVCFFPLPSFATRPPRKTLVYFVALSDNGDMFMAGFYLICLFYSSNKKNIMKMSYLNVIFILSYHIFFS